MFKLHRYFIAAALTVAAAAPARLSAQVPLGPSYWQEFFWNGGAGGSPIDPDPTFGVGFSVQSSTQLMRIRITDTGFNGDAFNISVNGVALYQTPSVMGDGYFLQYVTDDPDEAYGNPLLSYFEFFLNPQLDPYLIELFVREGEFPDGSGFIRMDEFEFDPTPEPGALVMLATGLFGVAVVRRRRSPKAHV